MKSLQEYISEQMVCELSGKLLKSAHSKAHGSRQFDFGEGALKAYTKELEKLGFEFNDDSSYEDIVEYNLVHKSTGRLLYIAQFDKNGLSLFATEPDDTKGDMIDYFSVINGKINYKQTTTDRKKVNTMVKFAKVFDITLDKNELIG